MNCYYKNRLGGRGGGGGGGEIQPIFSYPPPPPQKEEKKISVLRILIYLENSKCLCPDPVNFNPDLQL